MAAAKRAAANAALVTLSLGVALAVSEIVLRIAAPYLTWDRPATGDVIAMRPGVPTDQIDAFTWRPDGNGMLHVKSKDSTLVYELRPSAQPNALIQTNSSGFRDREFVVPKPAGVFRIIAVGDSITFGWWEKQEDTYPKILEELLNAETPKPQAFEVYNMAVGGYNAEQELELLKTKVLPLQPDLIILQYCVNDGQYRADGGLWRHFTQTFSRTWDISRLALMRLREEYASEDLAKRCYRKIADLRRETGVPLAVLTVPSDDFTCENERSMEAFVRGLGLPSVSVIDTFTPFGFDNVMADNLHPNALGHRLIAEELYKYLRHNRGRPFETWEAGADSTFDEVRAHFREGLRLLDTEDVEGARAAFVAAARCVPAYMEYGSQAFASFALRRLQAGDWTHAAAMARAGTDLDSGNLSAWMALCKASMRLGELQGALKAYAPIRKAHPKENDIRVELTSAVLNAAETQVNDGRPDAGYALYQDACNLHQDSPAPEGYDVHFLASRGFGDKAARSLTDAFLAQARAKREAGALDEALDLYGRVVTLNLKKDEAQQGIQQIRELRGKNPPAP